MSAWRDPARWRSLCSGESCPICVACEPLDVVATLEASWVSMHEKAAMRGYACLVSKVHAVEIHDLPEHAAAAFWRDARKLSRTLAEVTGAVKLNCEIHGNTLPHLHLHFFPRYVGDAFEGKPIDPASVVAPVYAPGEFIALRDALVMGLDSAGRHRERAAIPCEALQRVPG